MNVAAALAASEHQVVLVDLDPQANATSALGVQPGDDTTNAYQALVSTAEGDLSPVSLCPTAIEHLHVLPGTVDAAAVEREFGQLEDPHTVFRRLLPRLGGDREWDFIVVDTPPGIGYLTLNALAAATDVILPVQAEYLALEGLTQMLDTLERVRENLNPGLARVHVVITMYDHRLKLAKAVEEELRTKLNGNSLLKVAATVIPRSVKLAEAPSYGLPVFLYDPASPGATAYIALAGEVCAL